MHIVATPVTRQFDVAYRVLAYRIAPGCQIDPDVTAVVCGQKDYLVTWHQLHFAITRGYSITLLPEEPRPC